MTPRTLILTTALIALALPGVLGASSSAAAPLILSAVVDGDELMIRGERLLAESGAPPFITLSGQVLELRPGFNENQIRVALPRVRPGTYLLTVAFEPGATAAGVLPVTLSPAAAAAEGPAAADGSVHVCANRRHTRVVDDPADCKRNERAYSLSGTADDAEPPDDGSEGEEGEEGEGEEGEDGEDGEEEAAESEEEDESAKCKNKGKGKGKKKKCD